ncbi:hypothetical protein L1889_03765 [Paenalcaligenes niemegkensis]|uniref:hypothetical protein n=1 Tax=Paenalcaligenes niemegkensis TaxID=2895469 RepID=UPI001EE80D66|nr:hypothetical protein [Paenalcaligenes niemegkensis]MCQ9615927.1 hypothetical protein [Paenalcaligenes niemegkensis]
MSDFTAVIEQPLFDTTHQALAFAFRRSNGAVSRPMMNRLASAGSSSDRGLGGDDGVAQAGLILRRLTQLGPLHVAILKARYGVRERICSCCEQPAPHFEWLGAIRTVSETGYARLSMPSVTPEMVRDLAIRYYSTPKHPLEDIGSRHGVSLSTASRANGEIVLWLRGPRKSKDNQQGEEAAAYSGADSLLRSVGLVVD